MIRLEAMTTTATLAALLAAGCACERGIDIGEDGDADGDGDSDEAEAYDPWIPDGPCVSCDDGNPCTLDLCNVDTGECGVLPLDRDGDGHVAVMGTDGTTHCGGDDCDDTRPDVYAGADEICMDGVDQDCDGIVDGPMVMGGAETRVTDTDTASHGIDITWTGSEWVLIWIEQQFPEEPGGSKSLALGRIDPAGGILSTAPVADLSGISGSDHASIAWSGSRLGTCWHAGEENIFATLTAEGAEASRTSIVQGDVGCSVVWTGTQFGAAVAERDTMSLVGIDPSLAGSWSLTVVPDAPSICAYSPPAIVWGGSRFGLAWEKTTSDGYSDIWFESIPANDTWPVSPERISDTDIVLSPDIAWTGSEYGVVASYAYLGTYFRRLDPEGEWLDSGTRLSDGDAYSSLPALSWTGSGYGVAWIAGSYSSMAPAFRLASRSGEPAGPSFVLTGSRSCMAGPMAIAWSGSEFGIAWADSRDAETAIDCSDSFSMYEPDFSGNWEVYFARVGLCQ